MQISVGAVRHNLSTLSFDSGFKEMQGPLIGSTAFHIGIVIISILGMPFVAKESPMMPSPIIVDFVEIDSISASPEPAPPKPVQKKPEPKLEKKETPPKPPAAPKMTAEAPPNLSKPKAPEVEPIPTPEAARKEIKPLEKKDLKPPPPKPKKEITKQVDTQQQNFNSLLKNLAPDAEEDTSSNELKETKQAQPQVAEQQTLPNFSDRLSVSEQDALRRQLSQCWNIMSGARFAENLIVEIRVTVRPDRTVQQATILDRGRYNRDSFYRAAADSALRALRNPNCSPLDLPVNKYEQWKSMVIRFDPKDIL